MPIEFLAIAFVTGMLLAIFIGMPVAIALGSVGLLGLYYVGGTRTVIIMTGSTAITELSNFGLLAIPLFMLMGTVVTVSGIGRDISDLVIKWLHRIPGSLHSAAVVSCAFFAALSSSSVATAAAIGGFILPEMKRRGYNLRLGIGAVAVGGTLGILIPPSNYFILYGVLTDTSISKLFLAGIVPGLMIASVMVAFNTLLFWLRPSLAAAEVRESPPTWPQKWAALRRSWTGIVLIASVIGGIFARRRHADRSRRPRRGRRAADRHACTEDDQSRQHQRDPHSGGPDDEHDGLHHLRRPVARPRLDASQPVELADRPDRGFRSAIRWTVLLLINLLLFVLGMFMDAAAITILTVPLLFPVIAALGFDHVWFGVVMAINLELALVTPPVGLNIFVLKAVANVSMREAILGTLPFAGLLFVCLIAVIVFPQIALWLPGFVN